MESSSMSSNGSFRKRGPTQCFCSKKPFLVVSWTPENPEEGFMGVQISRLQEEREEATHFPEAIFGDKWMLLYLMLLLVG
ncbi:hypothetical protein ACB092_07G032900 [Castanea dentata]